MNSIVRLMLLYILFVIITSAILKWILRRKGEEAIVEYKIDVLLNQIKCEIKNEIMARYRATGSIVTPMSQSQSRPQTYYVIEDDTVRSGPAPESMMRPLIIQNADRIRAYQEYRPYFNDYFSL